MCVYIHCVCVHIYVHTYTGIGKNRFTVVCMGKNMQVMVITIALLTQKNVTMQL